MKYLKHFEELFTRIPNIEEYISYLKRVWEFNEQQIEFLVQQRENYLNLSEDESFDEDAYERDMWYTMNQSGLFDGTDFENWGPEDTRMIITQYI